MAFVSQKSIIEKCYRNRNQTGNDFKTNEKKISKFVYKLIIENNK